MGGLTGETNVSLVENRAEKETVNVQTSNEVNIGELIWAKLNEDSWWPAQIADENSVSSANKPSSKGSSSDVLARLYGSYVYKYVDICSASAEFKSMLIKNNFNYHDILKKSLEQDHPSLSARKSRKRQQSKSKAASHVARHSLKRPAVLEMVQPSKWTKASASNEYNTSASDAHCHTDLKEENDKEVQEERQLPYGRNE